MSAEMPIAASVATARTWRSLDGSHTLARRAHASLTARVSPCRALAFGLATHEFAEHGVDVPNRGGQGSETVCILIVGATL